MANIILSGIDAVTGQKREITINDLAVDSGFIGIGEASYTPGSVTNGQTAFVLPTTPTRPTGVRMFVNGATYSPPTFFSVSGANITWFDLFTLQSSDAVSFKYI